MHLGDVVEPEPLQESELEHVRELRRTYGLAADAAFVRQLYEDPRGLHAVRSSSGMFGNLLVVPSELEQLKVRAEIEWQTQSVTTSVIDSLEPSFAGMFFEGVHLVVQCASCDPQSAATEIGVATFPVPLRDQVRIRVVKHSLEYLDDLEARVAAYLREVNARTNGLGVAVMNNNVEVNTNPRSPDNLGVLLDRRFPSEPVVIVPERGETQPFINKDEDLIFGLVEGGQAITATNLPAPCTSGFAVESGFGPFMLTAGHCFLQPYPPFEDYGPQWYQGTSLLGIESARSYGPYIDAGMITTYKYRNNYGRFHRTSSDYAAPVTFVPNFSGLINLVVCQSGRAWTGMTGNDHLSSRCGAVSSITYDLNNRYPYPEFEPVFIKAGMKGTYGDSGAAIVWPSLNGYGAVSVLHGGPNPDDSPIFSSRMDYIMYIWGLQLSPF